MKSPHVRDRNLDCHSLAKGEKSSVFRGSDRLIMRVLMGAVCAVMLIVQNSWAVLVEFNGSGGNGQVLGRAYATGTPAAGDQLGKVVFTATDNVAVTTYSQILGSVAPSGGGRLALSARVGSTLTPLLNIDGSGLSLLQGVMTGNGSGLSNLNASAFSSGVLPLAYGGTGVGSLASGTMPYSTGTALGAAQVYYASTNLGVGVSNPSAKLDVAGKVRANSGTTGAPANGVVGGNGDRFILWPGSASSQPYSLGINSSNLWSSVPSGASYSWYQGGTERMRLKSDGGLEVTPANMAAASYIRLGSYYDGNTHQPAIDGLVGGNYDTLNTNSNIRIRSAKSLGFSHPSSGEVTIGYPSSASFSIWGSAPMGAPLVSIDNSIGAALMLKAALHNNMVKFASFYQGTAMHGQIAYDPSGGLGLYQVSDERLKKNITETEIHAKEIVRNISIIDYQFRDDSSTDTGHRVTGFSAQNLQEVYPSAVIKTKPTTDTQEVLMINPTQLIPVMVKQMQDMQKQMDAMQSRLDALEAGTKTP